MKKEQTQTDNRKTLDGDRYFCVVYNIARSSLSEGFCKKGVLKNFAKFTGKHLCQEACNFIKKETLAQLFSCEFCEISKKTFSYRTPPVAASL